MRFQMRIADGTTGRVDHVGARYGLCVGSVRVYARRVPDCAWQRPSNAAIRPWTLTQRRRDLPGGCLGAWAQHSVHALACAFRVAAIGIDLKSACRTPSSVGAEPQAARPI